MDQTLHGVAGQEREEIKGMTKHKMARLHSKEGGTRLEQENIRQKAMEGSEWTKLGLMLKGEGYPRETHVCCPSASIDCLRISHCLPLNRFPCEFSSI